jgi:glycosyltransferase involved in cell wall biosynthesis
MAAKVIELDLAGGLPRTIDIWPHVEAFVLLRLHGRPIGTVRVPANEGSIAVDQIWRTIEADHALVWALSEEACLRQLAGGAPWPPVRPECTFTIIVCTRDRSALLRQCLESLSKLVLDKGTVLVVDNGTDTDETRRIVDEYGFDYEREPVSGLNRARRRAAWKSDGEISLFVDDDAVVDEGWLDAMLEPFADPLVGAVTGLAVPLELETDAQELFEKYSGFSHGFRRRQFEINSHPASGAGQAGSGVSMAIRTTLIRDLDLFSPELDAGTKARSGGDHYALVRVLGSGHRIVYQPDALVWHRHRPDYESMKATVAGYSTGVYTMLTRMVVLHHDLQALRVGWSWFRTHHLRELPRALLRRPDAAPVDLVLAEIKAAVGAPGVYLRTRLAERMRGFQ